MAEQGISAVQTSDFFSKAGQIEADRVFLEQSLFLKPNTGSRGAGCILLPFDTETGLYQLLADETIETQNEILAEINRRVQQQDYLLQPLLRNHQLIAELCDTSMLVTLRLVTCIIEGKVTALFAKLEIPCSDDEKGCWAMGLDLATGQLSNRSEIQHESFQKLRQRVDGKILPLRQEAVDICLEAHKYFPDLSTIGWDVVFTPSGVELLEGNINWGVAGHQILSDRPLLNTQLAEVYP